MGLFRKLFSSPPSTPAGHSIVRVRPHIQEEMRASFNRARDGQKSPATPTPTPSSNTAAVAAYSNAWKCCRCDTVNPFTSTHCTKFICSHPNCILDSKDKKKEGTKKKAMVQDLLTGQTYQQQQGHQGQGHCNFDPEARTWTCCACQNPGLPLQWRICPTCSHTACHHAVGFVIREDRCMNAAKGEEFGGVWKCCSCNLNNSDVIGKCRYCTHGRCDEKGRRKWGATLKERCEIVNPNIGI